MTRQTGDYFDIKSYQSVTSMLSQCSKMRSPHSCEAVMYSSKGTEVFGELIAVPITQAGDPATLLIIRDKTEQRLSEQALAESERHFRELADLLPEPVFEADAAGFVTFCNRGAIALLASCDEEHPMGIPFMRFFSAGDQENLMHVLDELLTDPSVRSGGFTVRAHDGGDRSVLLSLSPIIRDGIYSGIRGVIVDITEMKRYQETLQRTIDEKDVLFRELHHRVKNNMQVISSLLQLQEEYIDDSRVLSALHDCEQRIASMALVHETLYRSDSISDISFNDYLETLAQEVISGIATVRDIRTKIDVGDIRFNLDTVVTLGLIINELMVNSMKYAFTGKEGGTINIHMGHEEGVFVLLYMDDGVGLPPDFSIDTCNSLGMRLVRVLSRQLLGSVTIDEGATGKGVKFTVTFPDRLGGYS